MGLLIEGKTKQVVEVPNVVRLISKSDITAGDGLKHDILQGKDEISTRTTCNVFELLKYCGQPVAFYGKDSLTSFVAPGCRMIQTEVVVRGEAHGSMLKRNPGMEKGRRFDPPLVEFFLKTKDRVWKKRELPCDDPLMEFTSDGAMLYLPTMPKPDSFIASLPDSEIHANRHDIAFYPNMTEIATQSFKILRAAFSMKGYRLVDMKVEFGVDHEGRLLLADVIDNDSWRLMRDGQYVDKQIYRDGGDLDTVLQNYKIVADLTENFYRVRNEVRDAIPSL